MPPGGEPERADGFRGLGLVNQMWAPMGGGSGS